MARARRSSTVQAVGIDHPSFTMYAYNRTGSSAGVGELVMLDYALSSTEATDFTLGSATSGYGNFVTPTTAGLSTGRATFAIVVESSGIADDAYGEILLQGRTSLALTYASAGSISIGDLLWGDATGGGSTPCLEYNGTGETGYVYLGRAEAVVTTPTSPTAAQVLFDGIDNVWGIVP